MLLRSDINQIHLWLIISEIPTEKRALRKRHSDDLYRSFKKLYRSCGQNEIVC